jgi:hypothetical protein
LLDAAIVRVAILFATLLGFGGMFAAGYYKGGVDKKAEIRIETVTKVVEIVKKKQEIRNNRPEPSRLIDRLQRGEF